MSNNLDCFRRAGGDKPAERRGSGVVAIGQIARSLWKVLDTRLIRCEPDVRNGVVLAAHQIAADCAGNDVKFRSGGFLRQCGL